MTGHVRQNAAAEVPPPAPMKRQEGRVVRPLRSRAEPEVVIEGGRNFNGFAGQLARVRPLGTPDVNAADRSNYPRLHDFHHAAIVVPRVDLRAHLRNQFVLCRRLHHDANFVDGMGQGFLAIHGLACLHGQHGRNRVHVVGRADNDGVNAFVVKQLVKILKKHGLWMRLARLAGPVAIDIAKGHYVFVSYIAQVVIALAAGPTADNAQVEPFAGRFLFLFGADRPEQIC